MSLDLTLDRFYDAPPERVWATLAPEGGGTRLTLQHAETAPGAGADGHRGGWELTLARLESALH